jgi:arylsulfatase A-like enzyme
MIDPRPGQDRRNVILIIADTFRRDNLRPPAQGGPRTPHLDRFCAERAASVERYYCGSFPTGPNRTDIVTGRAGWPRFPWQPVAQSSDNHLARLFAGAGYLTQLICDSAHLIQPNLALYPGFHAWYCERGQEGDTPLLHANDPIPAVVPHDKTFPIPAGSSPTLVDRHRWHNRYFELEEQTFSYRTARTTVRWLEENYRSPQPFLLWVDLFDPHEPWDPPDPWDTYTDSDYNGPRIVMPMGGMASDWASDAEIKHIQGLYAGEAAFVDHCLGRLFDQLKQLGYYDDSLIFLLADHGHPLGDHGKFLKGADRMYNELLKIPFMVRLPKGEGARRTDAIVQFQDFLPTVLEALGFGNNISSMHGDSFLGVLKGNSDSHRDTIITGYHEGADRCIRDTTWSYIQRPEGEPDELYNLLEDPRERNNLIDQQPNEAVRLASKFGNYFWRHGSATAVKGIQGKYELASGRVE